MFWYDLCLLVIDRDVWVLSSDIDQFTEHFTPNGKRMEVSTTADYLRAYGFVVQSMIGTGSHILHFCVAPFGRLALVIEDGVPEEVTSEAVEGDQNSSDPCLCLVQEGTIILTYPGQENTVYYNTSVAVDDAEYYIVSLSSVYEDPTGTSIIIDDYFTSRSQQFFQDKLASVSKANEILDRLVASQVEAATLSDKIKKNYGRMHSLRNKCNGSLQSEHYEDTIALSAELQKLLIETEETAQTYAVLAEKILHY